VDFLCFFSLVGTTTGGFSSSSSSELSSEESEEAAESSELGVTATSVFFFCDVFRSRNPLPARLTNRGSFIAGNWGGFFDLTRNFHSGFHRVVLCFLLLVHCLCFFLAPTVRLVWG
jgi:hypothetical protein